MAAMCTNSLGRRWHPATRMTYRMCLSWRDNIGVRIRKGSGLEKDVVCRFDEKTCHVGSKMDQDLVMAEVGRNDETDMDLERRGSGSTDTARYIRRCSLKISESIGSK